jgi:hypothetical protein
MELCLYSTECFHDALVIDSILLTLYFYVWRYIDFISSGADVTLNMIWRDEFEPQAWSNVGSVRALGVVLSVESLKKNE